MRAVCSFLIPLPLCWEHPVVAPQAAPMCPHCNFLVSFSHHAGHVWISKSDKAVMTKHWLSAHCLRITPERPLSHLSSTPVENHYNWEQRWRKYCQKYIWRPNPNSVAGMNKGCCINLKDWNIDLHFFFFFRYASMWSGTKTVLGIKRNRTIMALSRAHTTAKAKQSYTSVSL